MNIITKVESQVKKTLSKTRLSKKDRMVVALSGGKDSATVGYLLSRLGYNVVGFHIDLGLGSYSKRCLDVVKRLCCENKIPLHVYNVKQEMGSSMCYLRGVVQTSSKGKGLKNCAICGVVKKWIMNREARRLKGKYIATGHNLDDEAQTFLINIFKGSPKLSANTGIVTQNISDKKFIPRVKPLFYVLEDNIREYTKKKKLPVEYEKCPCALDSYRLQARAFLEKLPGRDKEKIIKSFDKLFPLIKKTKSEDGKVSYCELCGEPSRKAICKKCELLGME